MFNQYFVIQWSKIICLVPLSLLKENILLFISLINSKEGTQKKKVQNFEITNESQYLNHINGMKRIASRRIRPSSS